MLKNTNKTKKTRTNFDLTTDYSIEKYLTVSIKFKIPIFKLIAKILLKQQILNQIRHCFGRYIQMWHYIFYQKLLKYFNYFQFTFKAVELKQNQTCFYGAYSNLKWFFIGRKILKNLNDFYNWHLSISLQNWAQTNKMK